MPSSLQQVSGADNKLHSLDHYRVGEDYKGRELDRTDSSFRGQEVREAERRVRRMTRIWKRVLRGWVLIV